MYQCFGEFKIRRDPRSPKPPIIKRLQTKLDAEGAPFTGRRIYLYLTPQYIYPADHIRNADARPFLAGVESLAIVLYLDA